MIEIKYGLLKDDLFNRTLGKLFNNTKFNKVQANKVARFLKKFLAAEARAEKEYVEFLRGYVEVDEKGRFMNEKDVDGKLRPKIKDGKKEEFHGALDDFAKKTLTVDENKFSLDCLHTLQLSPQETVILEPLLHSIEYEEGVEDDEAELN